MLDVPSAPHFARRQNARGVLGVFLAAVVLSGCTREVMLRGVLPNSSEGKFVLEGGDVDVFDKDGVHYSSARTDQNGWFRARAPRGETVFLQVDGEDLAAATFTGVSGFTSPLTINLDSSAPPDVHGVQLSELEEWETRFEGCPGLGEGLTVLAEVRAFDLTIPGTLPEEHPLMNRVTATVLVGTDDRLPACYLDNDGMAYDPDAVETGLSGVFAIPGVPPGLHTLEVKNELPGGIFSQALSNVLVEEAVVAPRFPFFMDSGLTSL